MTGTSLPIAMAAQSQANTAAAEAGRAMDIACQGTLRTFQPETATVAAMQQYAACVDRLHPDAMPPDITIALQAWFVFTILCIVVFVRGMLNKRKRAGDSFVEAVVIGTGLGLLWSLLFGGLSFVAFLLFR